MSAKINLNKFCKCLFLIASSICTSSCSGTQSEATYKITFKNFDGFILTTQIVKEGEVPNYKGAIPYRANDGDLIYKFAGWNNELAPATSNAIYIAQYDPCYQVTWLDENEDVIETYFCKQGEVPECSIIMQDKKDNVYYFEFKGWNPQVVPCQAKATYKAVYEQYDRYYTVTWRNYNGDTLEVDEKVERNTNPEYNGPTPTRPDDGAIIYSFEGWDKTLDPVTENITFTAKYSNSRNAHTIEFRDSDHSLIKSYLVDNGEMPFFDAALPDKSDGTENFYIFKSWDKDIVPAYTDAVYTAVYSYDKSYIYNAVNKKSTYKLVYKDTEVGSSFKAATYFQKYFEEITGLNLTIVNENKVSSTDNNQDYISFGKTKFANKYNLDYSETDNSCKPDYSIINDYHLIVVDGGEYGVVYGAVELLRQIFDFDYLEDTEYYYNKNLKSYCVSNIAQKQFCPIIRYRQNYTSGLIRKNSMKSSMKDYGMGRGNSSDTNLFVDVMVDGTNVRNIHNALQLLPIEKYKGTHPEWFSKIGRQPCMSEILESEEALNKIVDIYEVIAEKYPDRYLVYSLGDVYATTTETACNCSKCEAYFHKYGNDSGVYMLLLNKLGDMIKERQSKGKIPSTVPGIMGTAYYSTSDAPFKCTEEVKAHDNVAMQVCPIFHNNLLSYKECEKTYFDDWNEITNGKVVNGFFYSLVDYSTGNYLLFHNDFDAMFDNFEVYKKVGLKNIIQLGTMNASYDYNFANLRAYLYSYLYMNDNITKEDFDNQIHKYFDEYFGPAGDYMEELFNKLRNSFDKFKHITTSTHDDSWHKAFTRISNGSITTKKPVTDINGNVYGIATNYDLLNGKDESKQVVLFSSDSSHDDYIGNYYNIVNNALNAINDLSRSSDEYNLYYKRIIANALVVFYVNIECFNDESLMSKTQFMNFCDNNNIDRSGETIKIDDLRTRWGLN